MMFISQCIVDPMGYFLYLKIIIHMRHLIMINNNIIDLLFNNEKQLLSNINMCDHFNFSIFFQDKVSNIICGFYSFML